MKKMNAVKVTSVVLGVLIGLSAIDHGIFEILQGNTTPDSLIIAAIGADQRFWQFGEETAFTIIPSFLWSGILSVLMGVLLVAWVIWLVGKPKSAWVLIALSVLTFLVGGGFAAPIFLGIPAVLLTARIGKPVGPIFKKIPKGLLKWLGDLWVAGLVIFLVIFLFSVMVAILGWPLTHFMGEAQAAEALNMISMVMMVNVILTTVFALAHQAVHSEGTSND